MIICCAIPRLRFLGDAMLCEKLPVRSVRAQYSRIVYPMIDIMSFVRRAVSCAHSRFQFFFRNTHEKYVYVYIK